MKNNYVINLIIGLFVILSFSFCNQKNQTTMEGNEQDTIKTMSNDELVKKGEYLVTVMSCEDCHSPKNEKFEVINATKLSGYQEKNKMPTFKTKEILQSNWVIGAPDLTAWMGGWGMSFAANITSDQTGIGTWSEEQFKIALTQGKYKGMENGRDLLPPMPWQNYKNLKEEEISAIFAYLKSTTAVRNVVPAAIPPK